MPVSGWVPKAIRAATLKPACERCGATERIGLHHKDHDRTNNQATNLETLCPACHTREHWADGKTAWKRLGKCEVCDLPARKNGFCPTHNSRFRRHGHPLAKRLRTKDGWITVLVGGKSNPTLGA